MIVTVTPNPSVDRAYDVDGLARGEVQRARAMHVHPGGKGINVSRALVRHGVASLAVLPVGGADGRYLVDLLHDQRVPSRPVPICGNTRSNVTLVEADGTTTKINAPGPRLGPAEVQSLVAAVQDALAAGDRAGQVEPAEGGLAKLAAAEVRLVAAGSLPLGAPADLFARLAGVALRAGVPFALDTSGEPLRRAVLAGGLTVVKPNEEELAELVDQEIRTVADALSAAAWVRSRGTREVLVSLGAHGALLADGTGTWWAGGPALRPSSTVGAGDVTLAGYLAAVGSPAERLRTAVAWGRAAVLLPGSAVPGPEQIDVSAVRVVADPDPRVSLEEL